MWAVQWRVSEPSHEAQVTVPPENQVNLCPETTGSQARQQVFS